MTNRMIQQHQKLRLHAQHLCCREMTLTPILCYHSYIDAVYSIYTRCYSCPKESVLRIQIFIVSIFCFYLCHYYIFVLYFCSCDSIYSKLKLLGWQYITHTLRDYFHFVYFCSRLKRLFLFRLFFSVLFL